MNKTGFIPLTIDKNPLKNSNLAVLMRTDPYISKQLLEIHLNPELDLTSRKINSIEATVEWIPDKVGEKKIGVFFAGIK